MRRIVVSEFMSVDGVMEDPGGVEGFDRGGWAFQFDRGSEGDKFKLDEVMDADAMLLGRVTYEGFAAAWPERSDDAGFADKMNSMQKFVVSNTLKSADWNNSTIVSGDVVAGIRELKQGEGGDLLVAGSARLVHALIENNLVDEYRLMIFPVVLGAGKRMWADTPAAAALDVVDSRKAGEVLIVVLHPKQAEAAAGVNPPSPTRHLQRAKDTVDARYREPLDVADLARAAHLSPAHFSREFTRTFGEPPHRYLLTRRMERAADLLRNTDRSVADICLTVGLRSVGSFTTSFGRAYGMSPTAYRASHPPARVPIPACLLQAYARPSAARLEKTAR